MKERCAIEFGNEMVAHSGGTMPVNPRYLSRLSIPVHFGYDPISRVKGANEVGPLQGDNSRRMD